MGDGRRAKGSGSVRWIEAEHRYRGLLRIKGESRVVYAPTLDAIETKLRHLRANVEQGTAPKKREPLTVEVFLRDWIEKQVHGRREPSTYRGYRSYIDNHIIPAIGSKQLNRLTPQDVQDLINSRTISPTSIRQLRAILRVALNYALRMDLVSRNVAELTEGPRVRKRRIAPLTPDQARAFLAAIEADKFHAIYVTAIGCGLRLGEVLGLRWQDVGEGWLTVKTELQRVDGEYVLKGVKTDDSRRQVALPLFVADAIERQRAGQQNPGTMGLVFTTDRGRPVNGSYVTHRLYDILDKAELPRQRFHDLRHCFASVLIAQGASLKEVKDVLGHSQISLVADLYGHLYEDMRKEAAARMQRALG